MAAGEPTGCTPATWKRACCVLPVQFAVSRTLASGDKQHQIVQRISVEHTRKILGGFIGVMFYDVTTLYFETDREDDLRKTGFSKEGKHSNPQIILGLLVGLDGYPLAYCIHEGNKYEA